MADQNKQKKTVQKKTLEAPVYTVDGTKSGVEQLSSEVFGQEVNEKLIAQYVRVYLNNQRQGNANTKTRSEVIGSTQKIWRQKGTGRARHGAPKANLFRGGGVTFGPKPRDFSMSLNKKQKKQALFGTLSQKAASEMIMILDAKDIGTTPKTQMMVKALKGMKVEGKALIVLSRVENNVIVKSLRNIDQIEITQATTLNAYDVLNHRSIIFVDDALSVLQGHFLKS